MTVYVDLIEGATLTEDENGLIATRVAIVTGLTGDGHARLKRALDTSGVPQRGDHHPSIPQIQCDTRQATPEGESSGIVRVTCTYRQLDPDDATIGSSRLEWGAGLTSETTHRNAYGKLIFYTYEETVENSDGDTVDTKNVTVFPAVDVMRCAPTYSATTILQDTTPAAYEDYIGTVSLDQLWLCSNVGGSSADGGVSYETTFDFQKATDEVRGWRVWVEHVKQGGEPLGSGHYEEMLETRDFSKLPIPWPPQ